MILDNEEKITLLQEQLGEVNTEIEHFKHDAQVHLNRADTLQFLLEQQRAKVAELLQEKAQVQQVCDERQVKISVLEDQLRVSVATNENTFREQGATIST